MKDGYATILILSSLFTIVLLIGMIVIIFQFKGWAVKRDKYYTERMNDLEERIYSLEKNQMNEVSHVLKENKLLLEKLREKL